ncbi:hypothetical protein C922_05180 [Plasmodium inui San Antonio 1]|uniref:Uncharacterized protein n=1 Tax=Plasmodium inui San Antonio 1 TaxID=1237626 RepID=W7AGK3_9APIC|nr:hypothetical protein C922_05180 [Plasmodium inui San Antonio 1]EUD64436.1 hypothetical protein C922_05180 [Plasmodium inui San Antonio 1]
MTQAKNENWQLNDWGKEKDNWGYTPSPGNSCQKNSRPRYCYPELIKKGTSRWDGLSEWLKEKILQTVTSKWPENFNPDVGTGIKDSDRKPFNWGQVLHTIMNQIQTDMIADVDEHSTSRLWGNGEWYTILQPDSSLEKPWDKSEVGQKLLMTIVCILTGLTSSRTEEEVRYPGRGHLCGQLDQALMVDKDKWKRWLGNPQKLSREKKYECKHQEDSEGCKTAGMSLVLTVYRSLASLCTKCGPYSIARWVNTSLTEGIDQGEWYCEVIGRVMKCGKSSKRDWNINDLRMAPIQAETLVSQGSEPHQGNSEQGSDARVEAPNLTSSAQIESPFPTATQSDRGSTEQNPPPQADDLPKTIAGSQVGGGKSASFQHPGRVEQHQMNADESSRPENVPSKNEDSGDPGHGGPPQKADLGRPNTLNSDSGTSSGHGDVSRILKPAGQEGAGIPPLVGGAVAGVVAVILLGLASAYGIFRIYRGGKRARSRRDRINISVVPVSA